MKHLSLVGVGLFLIVIIPYVAAADTVKRTGEVVSLAADEAVEGNFYAIGNTVAITGTVTGDVVIAGGNLNMNGQVAEDVLALGGTVSINGSTTDDVRIVAGDVTIAGAIGGSLSVVSGRVKILSTAQVMGDVMVYGGEAVIEGVVEGHVYGTVESLRIDGTVVAGVEVTTQNLQLGNRSTVEGNITYVSSRDLLRASNATVGGTIQRNDPPVVEATFSSRAFMIQMFILLFTTLVTYLVFRRRVEQFVAFPMFNQHAFLKAILFGFVFLFAPFAIIVLFASVLGVLVGLLLLLLYLLLLVATIPAMSFVVAKLLMRATSQPVLSLLHIVAAVVLIAGLLVLPVFGVVLLFSLYLFTFGVLLSMTLTGLRR